MADVAFFETLDGDDEPTINKTLWTDSPEFVALQEQVALLVTEIARLHAQQERMTRALRHDYSQIEELKTRLGKVE